MTRRAIAIALLLAAASATTAANQARRPATPASTRGERPVPFAVGETLTYDIAWASFLTAATATVTVRDKRPSFDAVAYYVVAEGRPTALLAALYPLYYKADTLIDAATLLSQRGSLFSREGRRQRLREMRFDHRAGTLRYDVHGGEPLAPLSGSDTRIPPHAQDPLSAIFVLRALPFDRAATVTMPIAVNGRTQLYTITRGAVETVTCGLGAVRATRFVATASDAATAEARDLVIFLSDDARRLPVKLQAELPVGAFVLTLTQAQ